MRFGVGIRFHEYRNFPEAHSRTVCDVLTTDSDKEIAMAEVDVGTVSR